MSKLEINKLEQKFSKAIEGTSFSLLSQADQKAIHSISVDSNLSFQEIKRFITMATDLKIWGGSDFSQLIKELDLSVEEKKDHCINKIATAFDKIIEKEKDYQRFPCPRPPTRPIKLIETNDDNKILGKCPVASEKTRCCNLMTLDAVRNCGFDCSYCSIQSFYYDDQIYIDSRLEEKLSGLKLELSKRYHIGTGQSSDSLMWGNRDGLLEKLFSFARSHPNVILELKTKSANIKELLELNIPPNVITSWSLNTPTIIANEEHHTASLDERLQAAKKIHDGGHLIGFHFHPMVIYPEHLEEYQQIVKRLEAMFSSEKVAMVSMGTLTFIKPVLKKLRKRMIQSKILQMPMEEIAGKYSYPLAQKEELFSAFYSFFSNEWRDKVFFYLCMEDPSLWQKVFGHQYQNNEDFEKAMIDRYFFKINSLMK